MNEKRVLHYTQHGTGRPLVLLHANPGDGQDFEAVIPRLSGSFRVIALDWPGYGNSECVADPKTITVSYLYEALLDFLAKVGVSSAFFIGNSVGGNVAARMAAERPEMVLGLILVSPGGFTPQNLLTKFFCRVQGSLFSLSPYRFARLYLKHSTSTTKAMLVRAKTVQATAKAVAINRALWRSFGRPESDLRGIAPKITAPTLLIFGKHDPVISAKRDGKIAAKLIPHAHLRILDSGHAPFAEVPLLFLAETLPFIEKSAHEKPDSTVV